MAATRAKKTWDRWEDQAWRLPPEITIDRWAEENIRLPRITAEAAGQLSLDRTPFVREILRAGTDPEVEEIALCFAAQSTKTICCQLIALYYLAEDPWPILHVAPREDDATAINTDRYQRIILESPNLRRFLTGAKADMTREAIRINGTAMTFVGANSPAALASRAIAILILDETDKYPPYSGQEADPIALARERTTTFSHRKIIKASTPTTERGYIWQEFLQGDRRRYWVPCPRCGGYQLLTMGNHFSGAAGLKWPEEERDPERIIDGKLAWYECAYCHGELRDGQKLEMLKRGKWVPEAQTIDREGNVTGDAPPRRRLSYHLSRLYAPWANTSWSHVAAEFLKSYRFPSQLMNFRNQWLAEIWQDKVEEVKTEYLLAKKGGYHSGVVPEEAHFLTAGVDVQLDHLFYVIRAWGAYCSSWLVKAGRVETFEALHRRLYLTNYATVTTGEYVPLEIVYVDSGYRTEEVYGWCRMRGYQPIKGDSQIPYEYINKPQIHPIHGGFMLTHLNSDRYKEKIHRLIRIPAGDPGSWHLPEDVEEEYLNHLVAEQRVLVQDKKTGRTHYTWMITPKGAPNHFFDCELYALAAATNDRLDAERRLHEPPRRGPKTMASEEATGVAQPQLPEPIRRQTPAKPRIKRFGTRFFT